MTRSFNQLITCPNCGTWITHETSFGRWIRNNTELDSVKGYSVTDQDYWIHKFKVHNNREFQCLMLVEIKTMGAKLSDNQRDTLHMVNQLTRNRGQINKNWQAGRGPIAFGKSLMTGKDVILRAYGMHVLTFSHLGPDDSSEIIWDKTSIDKAILTSLLKFDLDPDTMLPLDLRLHHKTHEYCAIEMTPLGFSTETVMVARS